MRERYGETGGSGQWALARWTRWTRDYETAHGGKAAGLRAKQPLPQDGSKATPEAGDAEA